MRKFETGGAMGIMISPFTSLFLAEIEMGKTINRGKQKLVLNSNILRGSLEIHQALHSRNSVQNHKTHYIFGGGTLGRIPNNAGMLLSKSDNFNKLGASLGYGISKIRKSGLKTHWKFGVEINKKQNLIFSPQIKYGIG